MTTLPEIIKGDMARAARLRAYAENQAYYDGEHRITHSTRLFRRPRNMVDTLVDTIVDHMGSPSVSWGQDERANAADEHLTRVLKLNAHELLDHTTELGTTIKGDGCWKVTFDDVARQIRIVSVDPAALWALAAPDDPTELVQIAHQYEVEPPFLPLLFPNTLITAEKAVTITESWTTETWDIWANNDLVQSEPNPYAGDIPYVLFPNVRQPGHTWGTGDPARMLDGQDRLNDSGSDFDAMMALAHAIVVLSGVTDKGDVVVRPGAIWELPKDAQAEVLDLLKGNSASQRQAYHQDLRVELQQAARVPDLALGLEQTSDISGTALQVLLGPLLRLVARKRLTRTEAHRRRAHRIARLGTLYEGLPDVQDLQPEVYWTEALPSDRAEELANAKIEAELGVSRETILAKIGYDDAAEELAKRHQEDRTYGPAEQRPAERRQPADDVRS